MAVRDQSKLVFDPHVAIATNFFLFLCTGVAEGSWLVAQPGGLTLGFALPLVVLIQPLVARF